MEVKIWIRMKVELINMVLRLMFMNLFVLRGGICLYINSLFLPNLSCDISVSFFEIPLTIDKFSISFDFLLENSKLIELGSNKKCKEQKIKA